MSWTPSNSIYSCSAHSCIQLVLFSFHFKPLALCLSFPLFLPSTYSEWLLLRVQYPNEHWGSVIEFLPVPWFAISADAPAVFPILMKMGLMNCWEMTITCIEYFWKLVWVDTGNLIVVLFECHNIQKALVCFTLKTNGAIAFKDWLNCVISYYMSLFGGIRSWWSQV